MMKTIALATALTLTLGGAAFAQYNGPVNPGSGPTAGGVIGETFVRPQPLAPSLFPGLTQDEPQATGSIGRDSDDMDADDMDADDAGDRGPRVRRNGAGSSAGGVINQTSPYRR